jgi:hypothetical protein
VLDNDCETVVVPDIVFVILGGLLFVEQTVDVLEFGIVFDTELDTVVVLVFVVVLVNVLVIGPVKVLFIEPVLDTDTVEVLLFDELFVAVLDL